MHERFGRVVATVAAAALAAGCSLIPTYERPAAPVAASYPQQTAAPSAGAAAADLSWQRFFDDERLHRLIDIALRNNRDLRVAALNIEQLGAQLQVRRADQWPTVDAQASGLRQPGPTGDMTSLYTVGLGVTGYELDFFGRVRSLKEVALAQYLASQQARDTAQISLVAAVANVWMGWLADGDLLELTRRTLATRDESLELVQLKFDSGVVSELDLRQAQSLVQAARATLAQQQRQRQLDENALTLLLGQPLPAGWAASAPRLSDAQPLAAVPPGLPSDLLNQRPDVRQAELQLQAANANIGAARAAFFPRISLTGSVGLVSGDLSALFNDPFTGWSFAPQLVLPIFDAGRNDANLESARIGRDIALAQYERTVQGAFREVADALAGLQTLDDQLEALQAQADAEAGRLRLSDLRYRSGAASYLDLLDAQRSLFLAQQAVVQTRLAQLQNRVTLYKVLGGGWQPPEAAPAAQEGAVPANG